MKKETMVLLFLSLISSLETIINTGFWATVWFIFAFISFSLAILNETSE